MQMLSISNEIDCLIKKVVETMTINRIKFKERLRPSDTWKKEIWLVFSKLLEVFKRFNVSDNVFCLLIFNERLTDHFAPEIKFSYTFLHNARRKFSNSI